MTNNTLPAALPPLETLNAFTVARLYIFFTQAANWWYHRAAETDPRYYSVPNGWLIPRAAAYVAMAEKCDHYALNTLAYLSEEQREITRNIYIKIYVRSVTEGKQYDWPKVPMLI